MDKHNASTALAIIPSSLEDVRALAKSVAGSILLPDALKREPDLIMAVMAGLELGLPPMASLRGVNVIKGKPSLTAATMVAVVLGRGVAEYFECVDDQPESVTYETKRHGGKNPQRATWTMADAKRAGLGGDNWSKYPSDMLHARCMARLARRTYPDLLAGIYTPDEIDHESYAADETRSPAVEAIDAEIISEAKSDDATLAAIDSAATLDDLTALSQSLAKLPEGVKAEARRRYGDRKRQLQQVSAP